MIATEVVPRMYALARYAFISSILLSAIAACSAGEENQHSAVPAPGTMVAEATTATPEPTASPTPKPPHPLSIVRMRQMEYPGSALVVEQTLASGSNYRRMVVSYRSEGLKIFGLLTVPTGTKPARGFPVIVFNHGYIPPSVYRTTERYISYVDYIARRGYIVFKPDYRGHGESEGVASGGYGSPNYTIDVLNAVASLKKYRDADPNRIGMWGHSLGGQITLRSLVTVDELRAGVIWAGVVAPYPDLFAGWRRPASTSAGGEAVHPALRGWRLAFFEEYGSPDQNLYFWNSISPNAFVDDISAPVQLHHSPNDSSVPFRFSEVLNQQLKAAGKVVEFHAYPGDDHNLAKNFTRAMQRTVDFFDRHVKGN